MTSAEFPAWDANEPARHEFVRGDVFAMAGASECHIVVTGNLFVALRAHLRGTPCRPLMTDMKLRVEAADCFFYPDLMVTCEPPSPHNEFVKTDAKLVVEVLSPTTAAYDRGDKLASYRQLPSLLEYLLVDVDTRRCDLFRKQANGLWVLHPFEPNATVQLDSVALGISGDALWADVDVTTAASEAVQKSPPP